MKSTIEKEDDDDDRRRNTTMSNSMNVFHGRKRKAKITSIKGEKKSNTKKEGKIISY